MAKLFPKENLPHFRSTRDTRDRMDLITENVPLGAEKIRADRIVYHPGDTAARHFHKDCHHLFYILEGQGVIHVNEGNHRLKPSMIVLVEPNEVHWFENDTGENFSFVEFWAPPPSETVWVVEHDC